MGPRLDCALAGCPRRCLPRGAPPPEPPAGASSVLSRNSHHEGGFQVTERWRIDSADELIAVVAAQIASLVATEQPALVKRCAAPACTLWFVDRTKAHSRLFCSATACGNRAKVVAAFRERQRGT